MSQTKYDVFISYSRKDYVDENKNVIPGNEVSKILDALKEAGVSFWFDQQGIVHGEDFGEKILQYIKASKIFVYLSTANANKSKYTSKEIASADECGKYIIPVRIDMTPYSDSVMFRIADRCFIDYFANPQEGLQKLVESIRIYLEQLHAEEEREAEAESQRREKARIKQEEEDRKREEEKRRHIDEQNKLVNDIKIACKELSNQENGIEVNRDKLLVRTNDIEDPEQRSALLTKIMASSPIKNKYQSELTKKENAIIERDRQIKRLRSENETLRRARIVDRHYAPSSTTGGIKERLAYWIIIIIMLLSLSYITWRYVPIMDLWNRFFDDSADLVFEVNDVTFKMVYVEGGSFQMGHDEGAYRERPAHEVKLDSFYISQTEVTQELWEAVMGTNPCYRKGLSLPVVSVSWDDCQIFLSKLDSITGRSFRLPTEAEWEYAARGGNKSRGSIFSGCDTLDIVAWYVENSDSVTHTVATKAPNELGLYDMSGNVWEWCNDWYEYSYYKSSIIKNPQGPISGYYRILRGGSRCSNDTMNHVSYRSSNFPTSKFNDVGFRLAL